MHRENPGGREGGLRQEDVAALAGLSLRRYAALERGEAANPSVSLIESIATALRMSPAERSALHVLAVGQDPPMPAAVADIQGEQLAVSPRQRELVRRLDPVPAAVTDEMWTIVARNAAMTAWTGGFLDALPPGQQNLILYLFSERAAGLVTDVHEARRMAVAGLRHQYTRNIASDQFAALIGRLLNTGSEARELWERHEIIIPPRLYSFQVRHPAEGLIEAISVFSPLSARYWLLMVMLPAGTVPPPANGGP
jgi:transcriptional regulator with XRE-family HTH domain